MNKELKTKFMYQLLGMILGAAALILILLLSSCLQTVSAQERIGYTDSRAKPITDPDRKETVGYVFVPNLWYTIKQKGPRPYQVDSVQYIRIIEDTMTVIKDLINYLDREREENMYAFMLLEQINLDHLAKIFNNKYFNDNLKEYRRVKKRNKAIEDSLRKTDPFYQY